MSVLACSPSEGSQSAGMGARRNLRRRRETDAFIAKPRAPPRERAYAAQVHYYGDISRIERTFAAAVCRLTAGIELENAVGLNVSPSCW